MNKKTPAELRKAFWNEDQINGGVIRNQYEEIKNVLKSQDFEFVKNKLRFIKEHAIKNTEFYSKYSVDSDFPVMNKAKLIENKDICVAKAGYDLPLHISSTSGSTGTPFSVVQNYTKRMRTIADLNVFGELADYPSHECMVFFRALNSKMYRTPEQEDIENIYFIDSSDLNQNGLEKMRMAIVEKKPWIIFGYSNTLVEIAKYISSISSKENKFTMKSILTGGERLSENDRLFLKDVFNCKVYRRYSDMELGILGQDDGNGGVYKLNWGSYYFECLKLDTDEKAADGEIGRIVITDLFNYAFPMIRYDTGDLGVVQYNKFNFPEFKDILGRSGDCVYSTHGDLVSYHKIDNEMWGANGVKQWQFIQESQNFYILKLNLEQKIDTSIYVDKFRKILGSDANIEIQLVEEIPVLSSTKRRAVICNYKKE